MIANVLDDLRAAVMLLTRIPVGGSVQGGPPDLARSVWAYPLVGAIVGGVGGVVLALAHWAGVPAILGAVLAVAAMVLATGAFHEDGLADTADGIGGGRTRAEKLEIMRDSRVGTYGTLAVVFCILIRVAALAAIADIATAAVALVSLAALSRGTIVALLALLEPARADGMGTVAGNPQRGAVAVGAILSLLPLALWPLDIALAFFATSTIATAIAWWLARRHLGGYTGDMLGAGQQIAECVLWVTAASLLA